jgi:hypothetical protein
MTRPDRRQSWAHVEIDDAKKYEMEAAVREAITLAVQEALPPSTLSLEEHRWLQLAMKRDAQSVAFRQKIIESTATWAILLVIGWLIGLGFLLIHDYAVAHGMWKP